MTKKTERPSPSAHAGEHKNKKMKGNDGNMYQSLPDKNSVYHWKKVTSSKAKKATTAATTVSVSGSKNSAAESKGKPLRAQKQQAEARLKKLIANYGLDIVQDQILAVARTFIKGSFKKANGKISLGISRVGGLPDVPADFVWPVTRRVKSRAKNASRPLSFIAQLNCADIVPYDLTGSLPKTGLLSFFFDLEGAFETWISDPDAMVLYTPAKSQLSIATAPPDLNKLSFFADSLAQDNGIFPPALIHKFGSGLNLPTISDEFYYRFVKSLGKQVKRLKPWQQNEERYPAEEFSDADEIQARYDGITEGIDTGSLQIFGYADFVQYGETSPKAQLLLQMSIPEEWDKYYAFGDTGLLYFWIATSDLQRFKFDEAWAYLQNC
jgi:uncharacterized protein YwqG